MKQEFIEDNIIILSRQTIDEMLKDEDPSDLIGLYCFYYYTAKWQKTNTIKCTTNYASKGLKWTKDRVIKNKKKLQEIGLIEDKVVKNEKGQVEGWYIKVKYIWKKETIKNQRVAEPEGGLDHRVENPDTNALSVGGSINALSVNNESSEQAPKELEPSKEPLIRRIIDSFEGIDGNKNAWYAIPAERKACEELLKRAPIEKLEKLITTILPQLNSLLYNPAKSKAFKPSELNRNWAAIMAKLREKQTEQGQRSANNKMKILKQ